MRHLITKLLVGAAVIFTANDPLFAQNPERIDFEKEHSNSLVWEEKVPASGTKEFVFSAKKGQKLSLSFVDDTQKGSMDWGKVSIEPNADPFVSTIDVTKDYRLSVSNNSDKETSFRIAISLESPKKAEPTPIKKAALQTATNAKEIVRFAKGATSATLTRTVAASGSIDFIIHARKGQKMDFTIGYDFDDSDIEGFLTEPGLQDISLTIGPKKPNEFVLKKTGNHRLTVNNTTAKNITITLYLSIE